MKKDGEDSCQQLIHKAVPGRSKGDKKTEASCRVVVSVYDPFISYLFGLEPF